MKTDVLNSISGHLIDARWALWALDWPQERDLAQTLLFTIAEPLLVLRLLLMHQHPAKLDCRGRGAAIPSLSQPLCLRWLDHKLLFIILQQSLQWPSRRLTPWLTTGGPAMPEPGQSSGGWQSEGSALVCRPVQGCWLRVLTLACSPPVGSCLDLRRPRSPAENRGWAAIHWSWTRRCVRLSADHRGPSRSAGPGSCCWPQIREWKQPRSLGKAFCSGDMCEKSQLAGIRLHGAVTPQFIILIRLLASSSIPHIHKGVMVGSSTTQAELTLRKSRWWFLDYATISHIRTTWVVQTLTCREKKKQYLIHPLTQISLRSFSSSMYGQVSDLMWSHGDETARLHYLFTPAHTVLVSELYLCVCEFSFFFF